MTVIAPRTGTTRPTLVIDLDTCVGCHACSIACKGGSTTVPLADAVWPNQVFGYEGADGGGLVHVPRLCQHCEQPDCVTVCPTGASYRRAADGIVLIDAARCIGCRLCAWACPYGAREYDAVAGVMRKCTLCAERREAGEAVPACVATCPSGARHFGDLGDPASAVSDLVRQRGGFALMPEAGYGPTVRYLPRRSRRPDASAAAAPTLATGAAHWIDRVVVR